VISQRLVPRADGKGRVAAIEVLLVTPEIRDLLRDRNRLGEIRDFIANGREQHGMQSFDQHLMELAESGTVTLETARAGASNPADFGAPRKTPRKDSRVA
jgi:twitching motility protein PilT